MDTYRTAYRIQTAMISLRSEATVHEIYKAISNVEIDEISVSTIRRHLDGMRSGPCPTVERVAGVREDRPVFCYKIINCAPHAQNENDTA